ncbi:MAG: hypothetical protein EAY65_07410 [Alphaproteobacteria bacterium]|nr:MAG: hypothetical protein EAY65_07410 [Alphaproteobacteria bacterium]
MNVHSSFVALGVVAVGIAGLAFMQHQSDQAQQHYLDTQRAAGVQNPDITTYFQDRVREQEEFRKRMREHNNKLVALGLA